MMSIRDQVIHNNTIRINPVVASEWSVFLFGRVIIELNSSGYLMMPARMRPRFFSLLLLLLLAALALALSAAAPKVDIRVKARPRPVVDNEPVPLRDPVWMAKGANFPRGNDGDK
jgi:hypothetical protein